MMCAELLEIVKNSRYVGLPGAGGDDAIFIIYKKEGDDDLQKIQDSLEKNMAVLPVNII